jgi:hypothetical protein
MAEPNDPKVERLRAEPEIIPPSRKRGERGEASHVWVSVDGEGGTQRIYIARPGPFSLILAIVLAGLVLATVVLVVLGLVLFWIPVAVIIIAVLLLSGTIRYYWWRLRHWLARR